MACACKNKIKKAESLIPNGKYEFTYEKKGLKKILFMFAQIIGRIIISLLLLLVLPIALIVIIGKVIFLPDKSIVINLDKMIKQWKKHTD